MLHQRLPRTGPFRSTASRAVLRDRLTAGVPEVAGTTKAAGTLLAWPNPPRRLDRGPLVSPVSQGQLKRTFWEQVLQV